MSAQKKIICEGELLKRCRFAWSPRHVCLISGDEDQFDFTLMLYDQRKRKLRKQFAMSDISSVKAGRGNSFRVFLLRRGNPVIQLRSRSEEERANWMALLKVGIGKGNVFHVKNMSKVNLMDEYALAKFVGFANGENSNRFLHIYNPVTEDPIYIWALDKIKQFVPTDIGIRMELCERCYRSHSHPKYHTFVVPTFFLKKCLSFFCREAQASIVYVGGDTGMGESGAPSVVYQVSSHSCGDRKVPPKSPAPPLPAPEESLSPFHNSVPTFTGMPRPQADPPGVGTFREYPTIPARNPNPSDIRNVPDGNDHSQPIRKPQRIPPPLPPRTLPRFGYYNAPPAYIRPDPTEPYSISKRIFIDDDGKRLSLAHTPRSSVRYPHQHSSSFVNMLPPRQSSSKNRNTSRGPQAEAISALSQSTDAAQSSTHSTLPSVPFASAQHQPKLNSLPDSTMADHISRQQSKLHQPSANASETARLSNGLPAPCLKPQTGAGHPPESLEAASTLPSVASQLNAPCLYRNVSHLSSQGVQVQHAGLALNQQQQKAFSAPHSTSGADFSGYEAPRTVHQAPIANISLVNSGGVSLSGEKTQQSQQLLKEQPEENQYYNVHSASSKMQDAGIPSHVPPRVKAQAPTTSLQATTDDLSKNGSTVAWIPVHPANHMPRRNKTMKELRQGRRHGSLENYYDEKASHVGVIQPVFDGYNEAPARHSGLGVPLGEASTAIRKPRSHTVDVLVDYPLGDNPLYASQHSPNEPGLRDADAQEDGMWSPDVLSLTGDGPTDYSCTSNGTFGRNVDPFLSNPDVKTTYPYRPYDKVETVNYQNICVVKSRSDEDKRKLFQFPIATAEPPWARHVSFQGNGHNGVYSRTDTVESSSNSQVLPASKPTVESYRNSNSSEHHLEAVRCKEISSDGACNEENAKALCESSKGMNDYDPSTGEVFETKHSPLSTKLKGVAPVPSKEASASKNPASLVKPCPPVKPKPMVKPKPIARPIKQ